MHSSELQLLLLGLAAFALALLLVAPVRGLVVRIGWLDKPNHRKLHVGSVPLAGGLLIASTAAIMILSGHLWNPPAWQLWAAAAMIFVIAFIDDRFPIRARFRLTVQLVAAILVAESAEWVLPSLGRSLGPFELGLGVLALPFTVLGIAALTNAINMTDGIDGMAGGLVAASLWWLLVGFVLVSRDLWVFSGGAMIADAEQAIGTARAIAVLIGATLAFLVFNQRTPWRSTAAMFLGDAGSMMLGFTIAALCVHLAGGYGAASAPAAAVGWIVAVPLIDMFACFARRLACGVTPMTPDRRHMHHLLLAIGLPVGRAVLVLQLACLLCGAIGIVGWRLHWPQAVMFYGLVVLFAIYFFGSLALWRRLQPGMDLAGRAPRDEPKATEGQSNRRGPWLRTGSDVERPSASSR